MRTSRRLWILVLGLVVLVGRVFAQDLPVGGFLGPPLSSKIWDDPSLTNLAGKGHKALGYVTVTLATAAFVVNSAVSTSAEAVELLSVSSAVSAGTTVLAGVVSHWGKLSFSGDLLTWNNLHALTAAVGSTIIVGSQWAPDAAAKLNWGLVGAGLLTLAIIFQG